MARPGQLLVGRCVGPRHGCDRRSRVEVQSSGGVYTARRCVSHPSPVATLVIQAVILNGTVPVWCAAAEAGALRSFYRRSGRFFGGLLGCGRCEMSGTLACPLESHLCRVSLWNIGTRYRFLSVH